MSDILLTPGGDLRFANGDIVVGDSVAQKIYIRLKWFEGEWRWNREEGLPYFERLFRKNPETDLTEALVRAKIFPPVRFNWIKQRTDKKNDNR